LWVSVDDLKHFFTQPYDEQVMALTPGFATPIGSQLAWVLLQSPHAEPMEQDV
jgi:hypothetical protein